MPKLRHPSTLFTTTTITGTMVQSSMAGVRGRNRPSKDTEAVQITPRYTGLRLRTRSDHRRPPPGATLAIEARAGLSPTPGAPFPARRTPPRHPSNLPSHPSQNCCQASLRRRQAGYHRCSRIEAMPPSLPPRGSALRNHQAILLCSRAVIATPLQDTVATATARIPPTLTLPVIPWRTPQGHRPLTLTREQMQQRIKQARIKKGTRMPSTGPLPHPLRPLASLTSCRCLA